MSILLALKTSGDQIPQFASGTWVYHALKQFPTGNTLIFGLSVGYLVSLVFYFIVIDVPRRMSLRHMKRSFIEQYEYFKTNTISIFLAACDEAESYDKLETLSDQEKFTTHFNEEVTESQSRWHVVMNNLSGDLLRDLLIEMEILRSEISFLLANAVIYDSNVFDYFKRLSVDIQQLRKSTSGYDDIKRLCNFLWCLFSGFDPVNGYRENDIVLEMLERI